MSPEYVKLRKKMKKNSLLGNHNLTFHTCNGGPFFFVNDLLLCSFHTTHIVLSNGQNFAQVFSKIICSTKYLLGSDRKKKLANREIFGQGN